jgi:hypothetical protein
MNEFLYEIANIPFDIKGLKIKHHSFLERHFQGKHRGLFYFFFSFVVLKVW